MHPFILSLAICPPKLPPPYVPLMSLPSPKHLFPCHMHSSPLHWLSFPHLMSADGHPGWIRCWWTSRQASLWHSDLECFRSITRNDLVKSSGTSVHLSEQVPQWYLLWPHESTLSVHPPWVKDSSFSVHSLQNLLTYFFNNGHSEWNKTKYQ